MMPSRIEAGYNRNACSGGIRDGTYALGARKILISCEVNDLVLYKYTTVF